TMNANGGTFFMGDGGIRTLGPVATSGAVTLHTSAFDTAGHTVSSIKIKEPIPGATNGSFNLVAGSTTSPFDFTFTPAGGNHAYYAYITFNSGDEMWSAPIWINQAAAPTPDFTVAASPASRTVVRPASTTYAITVGALNGFTGAVNLSVSNLPRNATASFSPASINGIGTSTLTISTASNTRAGTRTLTITGGSGTITHSATVSLTVQ